MMFSYLLLFAVLAGDVIGFNIQINSPFRGSLETTLFSSTSTSAHSSILESSVSNLKKVLEREYISFFNPMRKEFYDNDVVFDDPLNDIAGVDGYQKNVDMLAGRTLMGSLLFRDAGIVLHSIQGGEISKDGSISDVITRWTLRLTVKILPWTPTARFSGISVYEVAPGGSEGVLIKKQTDYWDSINLGDGDVYKKVDVGTAVADFLDQLKPRATAPAAGPELPYQLLRRGKGYEVRRYPSFAVAKIPYERRDEGFERLGAFAAGMAPLSPAIMEVATAGTKSMAWPISFGDPGEMAVEPVGAAQKAAEWGQVDVETYPSKVVAVALFKDASVEPVVRKADRLLREACKRDGLKLPSDSEGVVRFAQYDAVFSMGERRGEVWIDLEEGGHPW